MTRSRSSALALTVGRMRMQLGTAASALAVLAAATAASAAPADAARPRPLLKLTGASTTRAAVCGRKRRAAAAPPGTAQLTLAVGRARSGAAGGRLAVSSLSVDRCQGRTRVPTLRERVNPHRTAWTFAISTWPAGDYRLRVGLTRAGARRTTRRVRTRVIYLRRSSPARSSPSGPGGAGPSSETVDRPVSFTVQNVNRSAVSCSTDGATYRLSGHLVGPRSVLGPAGPNRTPAPAVTLYLHEFSYGQWFWRFPQANYDYAQAQAQAGHVSVVIDRLGYGASPHPPGTQTCLGAQADMAHQIVGQLRAGSYASPDGPSVGFGRVAIAGHSVGGGVAELEAYSFHDVDALVLFAWASQGFTPHATEDGAQQGVHCGQGGDSSTPGYAYYNPSADDFHALSFHDTDPGVLATALSLRAPDPCGDVQSLVPVIASSGVHSKEVSAPVLLVYGLSDAVYQQPSTGQQQSQMYGGSSDVTTIYIENAGHALALERSAPQMRAQVADWLSRHGF